MRELIFSYRSKRSLLELIILFHVILGFMSFLFICVLKRILVKTQGGIGTCWWYFYIWLINQLKFNKNNFEVVENEGKFLL